MKKEEILKLRAGDTIEQDCGTPLAAKSWQSQVSYVKKFYRDAMLADVSDYTTQIEGSTIRITAIGKEAYD